MGWYFFYVRDFVKSCIVEGGVKAVLSGFLDMLLDSFDFFVDIGNKVNVFGLNLWQVSLIAFVVALVFRFLFVFIFGSSGSLNLSVLKQVGRADIYKDSN